MITFNELTETISLHEQNFILEHVQDDQELFEFFNAQKRATNKAVKTTRKAGLKKAVDEHNHHVANTITHHLNKIAAHHASGASHSDHKKFVKAQRTEMHTAVKSAVKNFHTKAKAYHSL